MIGEEQWRTIVGWPDYAVSNLGRVKRLTSRTCAKAGAILKATPRHKRHPYPCVCLCREGKVKMFAVHRLVMAAFVGPPPPSHEVNHRDGDKTNPRLDNLEYATSSANQKHAYQAGLQDAAGEKNGQAVLKEADVIAIRSTYTGIRGQQRAMARQYNVSPATIRDAIVRRTWSHI